MNSHRWDDWDTLRELRDTPRVLALLDELAGGGSELQVQTRLRVEFPERLVRAAVSLRELRRKAVAKFSRADAMWFDRQGLEQATSEAVAMHKAKRFATGGTPVARVWDYCCGIGADAIAIAEHCDVVAVDVQPVNCLRAQWNAEAYGRSAHVTPLCADVERLDSREGWLHFDPDRRASGAGRVVRIEDYVPGLEFMQRMTREFRGGAIKLSPAANFGGKFSGVEIELVSLDGECKEATVWFGELAGPTATRATVLPAGCTLTGDPLAALVDFSEPLRYVYDPDPAVVRAGLVDVLAETLGLHRLDPAEEYLTSDRLVASPFVRGFEVLANLPNNDRAIRDFFRTSDFGDVEIKCRHIPIQAEVVRRKLPLPGSTRGTLIFARVSGKSRALACRRIVSE
ncbi:MAG: hypothetical protein HZA46_14355 [Planctomycetales bacterium]|nr:hypothetical protein [Planctomycetales bacterium]